MCGISGWFEFGGEPFDRERLLKMTRTLRHRGPDAEGTWTCRLGGLGHTRLSIIDLSRTGSQPMLSADGRYVIAYNGELYNYRELREQLVAAGMTFRGRSDTEVVVNAFAVWGPESFRRFNGIFALAVWDQVDERLWLARDRLGVKPLYYYRTGRGVVFGSEIKALLATEQVSARLNAARLREFLYFGVTLGRETLYQGVQRLMPGHWLAADRTECTEKPYWRLDEVKPVLDSYPDAAERVRELMEAAVRRQLVSDVPVGVFLSGGIDSACVATFAARNSTQRIRTFSVGFDYDRGVDELPKARAIAQALNAEHHELHVSGTDLPATLEALIRHHDQPFSDAANIPLYLLAGQVADQVKVVLQGDGGDEVFAGYRRYALLRSSRFWVTAARCAKWSGLARLIEAKVPRLVRILDAFSEEDSVRMALLLTVESLRLRPERLLSLEGREATEASDPFERYREMNDRFFHLEPVQRMLFTDMGVILPDVFLEKVDRATMAHGVEARVPFLDNEVVEYALGLPARYKVTPRQKKRVLRQALRGSVPDTVLDGPKTGFGVPFEYWLRGPLHAYARATLLEPGPAAGLLDRTALERCLEEHRRGVRDHGFLLWKLLNLVLWLSTSRVRV